MNLLFVTNKPPFVSSNRYLNLIKRELNIKKAGFSGTLDPFAKGCLIIATNSYTKLFPYLKKSPKVYKSTLFIGAKSKTLDIEKVEEIYPSTQKNIHEIKLFLKSLIGEIQYSPPIYSAKKIDGKRAYNLARNNLNIELPKVKSKIYDIELINYSHPFLTFQATVSEGTYIRSIGEIISKELFKIDGSLSYLERVKEGDFFYQNQKPLNPLKYLKIPKNIFLGDIKDIQKGKKISINNLKIKDEGEYYLEFDNFFSIIKIEKEEVKYKLNLIPKEKI